MENFVKFLKVVKIEKGWNIQEMAEYFGVSVSLMSKVLCNDRQPSKKLLLNVKSKFPEIDLNNFFA